MKHESLGFLRPFGECAKFAGASDLASPKDWTMTSTSLELGPLRTVDKTEATRGSLVRWTFCACAPGHTIGKKLNTGRGFTGAAK